MLELNNIHSAISGTMILGIVVGAFVFGHCIIYAATHDYETGRRLSENPEVENEQEALRLRVEAEREKALKDILSDAETKSNRVLFGLSRIALAQDGCDYANNYIDTKLSYLHTSTINNTTLVRVKCEYCDSMVPADKTNCPNCGAPLRIS